MPKKKASTATPAKAGPAKTANKAEPVKTTPATPAKPAEAAKPAATQSATKPAAAKASTSAPATKAAPTAAKATSTAAKTEKPAASTKGKAAKTSSAAAKVPASGKRAGSVVTVIVAKYDVGFGNSLYIRGEGPGINWDTGVLMKNVENDVWVWTTNEMTEGVVSFKFLLNDDTDKWSTGENLSASAGETTTVSPSF